MSTNQSIMDFILDQLSGLDVRVRRMFGEYALYCDEKVVALVCDDRLFMKITEPGREYVGDNYREGLPYPGAKPWMLIDEDLLEDREWLRGLVQLTADVLPVPKPKKRKIKQ